MCSAALTETLPLDEPFASVYVHPPYLTVEQGLSFVDLDGPEGLSPEALRGDLVWLASIQRRAEAMSARWLAELDSRQVDRSPDPTSSCSDWLHDTLHLTPSAAYAQVRMARRLQSMPATAAALARGELSGQQVAVICRALEEAVNTRLDPMQVESDLLQGAAQMDPRELLQHWQQLRYQADQEAGLEAEDEQRRRRWLHLQQTWSGSYRLEGELDAEGGVTLKTALKGLLRPAAADDERTPSQRRADALVELARRQLDAGDLPQRGGERPHLTLVAELSTLRLEPGSPLAQLDWGPLITGETARRLSCEAALTPLLVDENGEVLHVGRRSRTVPSATRRALNLRDRHCQWPGCTQLPEDCQAHHRRHWADGGPSVLANLQLYCGRHHALVHPENERYRRTVDDRGAPSLARAP